MLEKIKKVKAKHLAVYVVVAFIFNRILLSLESSYSLPIYQLGYWVDVSMVIAIVWLLARIFIEIKNDK